MGLGLDVTFIAELVRTPAIEDSISHFLYTREKN